MPRPFTFILYLLPFTFLPACDSASLNQSQANPFVVLAAQFAEGSVGSTSLPPAPTTQPHANITPAPAPTPSYQPTPANPRSASPHPVASSQHPPLTAANPPENFSTPW